MPCVQVKITNNTFLGKGRFLKSSKILSTKLENSLFNIALKQNQYNIMVIETFSNIRTIKKKESIPFNKDKTL
jgi:hypothetical protein